MESLIEEFINIRSGSGDGSGSGYGYGDGDGSGSGSGYGSGDGSGDGSGSGYGYGDGSGSGSGDGSGSGYVSGSGYGYGYGSGYGSGDGSGYGSGYGSGSGSGDGSGSGYGYGYGDGDGIKMIDNEKVYQIDRIPTIITHINRNVAKGFILKKDLTKEPCFVVKENNIFSHGKTLHEAYRSLQEKLYDNSSEEERIEKFKEHFPNYDKKYDASDLFIWHHVLTGSCKMGRESFAKDNGIDITKDKLTIYEFIELTKNSYRGDIIKKLI